MKSNFFVLEGLLKIDHLLRVFIFVEKLHQPTQNFLLVARSESPTRPEVPREPPIKVFVSEHATKKPNFINIKFPESQTSELSFLSKENVQKILNYLIIREFVIWEVQWCTIISRC